MIGVFDSGVGGLSVWKEIRVLLPAVSTVYVGDQIHIPYGPRPPEEVKRFSVEITRFLIAQGAGIVVVACNSASAAALQHLRSVFPDTVFVGMEPAVKPAALGTRSGVVGVLATPATFQGELFASLVDRYAEGLRLVRQICPGLVEQVEKGRLDTPDTMDLLRAFLEPMLRAGADGIVLGCTHYSFLAPAIARIAGPGVRIIDPSPAVAAQARRLAATRGLDRPEPGSPHRHWTTADPESLRDTLRALGLGADAVVLPARWRRLPLRLVAAT